MVIEDPEAINRVAEVLYIQSHSKYPVKPFSEGDSDMQRYWRWRAREVIHTFFNKEFEEDFKGGE